VLVIFLLPLLELGLDCLLEVLPLRLPVCMVGANLFERHATHARRICEDNAIIP